ncbi:MAG TPA: thioesterase family protein [Pseudonocardia sp.]|nr:thioesterase family protein [Pseudonocardia sp.]
MPAEAFYLPLGGGRFTATPSTAGPWFSDAQHMGPPSALLTRAMELCAPREGMQLARITVEVLGPVPLGEMEVSAEVERPGRTIEMLGAHMSAGGRTVLRARAWRMATGATAEAAGGEAEALPGLPGPSVWHRPDGWVAGYLDAMEWRWLHGGFELPGHGRVWARPRIPLVEGEQPSALQRLVTVSDSANGVGARLDVERWLFLNTELTVHVHRAPVGEWIGVDARTVIGPSGLGTVSAQLHDLDGHTGRATQALTVRPR